jgi:hypothetical protein
VTVPFPAADGDFGVDQLAVAPEGTAYVVPSGMHERLRRAVGLEQPAPDPKVALALAGWVCLQADGMTDRVNVDAADAFADGSLVRRFARAHDAGSVAVARHPSGEVVRSSDPTAFAFDDADD